MPSQAFGNLSERMKDIEQLIQAHSALTQFRTARNAAQRAGGSLASISTVVARLVKAPGRGRRAEVGAVNRAAIVLLCAHLQGYVEDLHAEAAKALFGNMRIDVDSLVQHAQDHFSNPHADRIEQLFWSLGVQRVLEDISWQRTSNRTVRGRLTGYIRLRNRIAHGSQESVSLAQVRQFKQFVELFAQRFDARVHDEIGNITGTAPW